MSSEQFSPLISVVIPVYNGANFLERAIASALAQTYPGIEVLVVNDGSNDNGATRQVALGFAERIRYIEKPNGGVASALNVAIANMSGEYLAWLSHDDEFLPEKLAKQVDFLQGRGDRENVVLFGGFRIENLATGDTSAAPLFSSDEMATGGLYRWLKAIFSSELHGCTTLIPRAVIEQYGVFDEGLKTTQDYDYFCRLLRGGVSFAFQEDYLILTRYHRDQGTLTQMDLHLRELDDFFIATIDRFRVELTSWRLLFVNDFMRILRFRGQHRALVHLFNTWCAANARSDAAPLWLYWECAPGTTIPEYILLCWKTIALHCGRDFRVTAVTPETLAKYLPNIDPCYKRLDAIAHRADFIRFNLLLEYGGIWLDSDMVALRSPAPVLREIEETGFAAMGYYTSEGPGFFPIISFLAAKPNNEIVAAMVLKMREGIVAKLNIQGVQPDWDELGGYLLRDIMSAVRGGYTFLSASEYFTFLPYWYENLECLERVPFESLYGRLHPGMYCQALTNSRDMPILGQLSEAQILSGEHMLAHLFRVAFAEVPMFCPEPMHPADAGPGVGRPLLPEARSVSMLKSIGLKARSVVSRYVRKALSPRAWGSLARRVTSRIAPKLSGADERIDHVAESSVSSKGSGEVATTSVETAREVFTRAYELNIWNHPESRSGEGSTLANTVVIRQQLPHVLQKYQVTSLLDLPCGDFNWMRHVDLGSVRYTGADIVSPLIAANREQYGTADRVFLEVDLTSDPLPAVDLMLCRDCLIHLSFRDINKFLRNLHDSGILYLLTNTYPERETNTDILTGQFRPVNLEKAPFSFPQPLWTAYEGCSPDSSEEERRFSDKTLALWAVGDLPRGCGLS